MKSKARILLVDDDSMLGSITKEYLDEKDLEVQFINNADDAFEIYKKGEFDICVLDVSMPMKNGFELAKDIRSYNENASIIFLTAKKEKEDKIQGLLLGADDYITKPFSMQELYLRIINVHKRLSSSQEKEITEFHIGNYSYNSISRKLKIADDEERLSEMEGQLLVMFLSNSAKRITREQALNEIWQDEDQLKSRSLSVYINKLRQRLSKDPKIEIINVYGTGYQLISE